jgi:nitrite reductase/ring-hydroxylating ferredoxin subunit
VRQAIPIGPAEVLKSQVFTHFQHQGREYLVVVCEGQITVFRNQCPHQGRAMLEPELEEGAIVCDHHSAAFDARSGEVADAVGHLGLEPLPRVPSAIRDGILYLTESD